MNKKKQSLLFYFKKFHSLIMQPGLDVEAFLDLIGAIFNSQDVCIMQLNEEDMTLKTIYTNPKTLPIKDILIKKKDIFSNVRKNNKFKTFFTKDTINKYPEVLLKEGIKNCIIGPIDVVEITEEFLIIGTHDEDVVFTDEDVIISEILSNFLSIKFRELQLCKEGKIMEFAGEMGFNLSLHHLRRLHINEDFLKDIKNTLYIYELARRELVNILHLFNVKTEMQGHSYIYDIKSRTKKFSSILEKMIRKNKHYSEFDDVAGIRIIVHYLSDINKIVNFIKQNPSLKIIKDDRKIEKFGPEHYRGHHLTVAVKTDKFKIKGKDPFCELQIRTTYQDSWSTKAHEQTYKKELNDRIKTTMALLSDQLYIADQQSEVLKETIHELNQN